jgi:hypothetical protein
MHRLMDEMIHHLSRARISVDQAERLPESRFCPRRTAGPGPLRTAALLLLARLLLGPPPLTIPDAHQHHPISPPSPGRAVRYRSRSRIRVQPRPTRSTTSKLLD